jgi:hypothetical protein
MAWNPATDASPSSPKAAGAGAVPPPRTLTVTGQILFVVGGQLAGVVLLPPDREGDVGHHAATLLPPPLAPATHPWRIAILIGKDQLGWVGGSRPGSRWT